MFRGTSKECPRSSNWRWFKEKDKIRTLGNEKQFFASGFVMKEKTRLLRKEGLGEWAKGCGVSVTLALVSTHCKLLRSTSSQSLTAGAPAWIGNVYGTNPHQWHLSISSSDHLSIPSSDHPSIWGSGVGGGRGHGRVLGRRHSSGLVRLCLRDPSSPCGKTQKMRFLSFVKGFQTWWQKAVFRAGNYYCSSLGAFSPGQVGDSAVNEDKKIPFTIAYMWNKKT